jgi:hypothetical protein
VLWGSAVSATCVAAGVLVDGEPVADICVQTRVTGGFSLRGNSAAIQIG